MEAYRSKQKRDRGPSIDRDGIAAPRLIHRDPRQGHASSIWHRDLVLVLAVAYLAPDLARVPRKAILRSSGDGRSARTAIARSMSAIRKARRRRQLARLLVDMAIDALQRSSLLPRTGAAKLAAAFGRRWRVQLAKDPRRRPERAAKLKKEAKAAAQKAKARKAPGKVKAKKGRK
jgi:hypothetical protein